jgi:hypothetical protein
VFRSTGGALWAFCLSGVGGGLWFVVLVYYLVVFTKPIGCDY